MAIVGSVFQQLAENQNLQAYFDTSLDALQTPAIWKQYLDVGLTQTALTFQTAIGRSRVEAAASVVDSDAPAPLRSRNKLELLQGKIPAIKEKFSLNQDEYRSLMLINSLPISDQSKKEALQKVLWNDLDNAATSTDKRLDIMTLQAVSSLTIDTNMINNPDGANYGTVDLLAKHYQKQGVPILWADPSSDPLRDIEAFVINIRNTFGRSFAEMEISYDLWLVLRRNPNVLATLAGFYNIGKTVSTKFAVTVDVVNEYLTSMYLPTIEVINEVRSIEKDGVTTTFRPFNAYNVSFQPAGKLGILHNAFAIEEWEPVPLINYALYGRALVKKWRSSQPWEEFTEVEMNAFPGIEAIDGIFILQSNVQQSTFIAA